MKFHLKVVEKDNVMWMVDALITLGATELHLVDNTHLEGGTWEITFINYNLSKISEPQYKKTPEEIAWEEVMREVNNG